MNVISVEKRIEAYQNAPEGIQVLYGGDATTEKLGGIVEKFHISDDVCPSFVNAVGDVILGFYPKQDLAELISRETKLSSDITDDIAKELESFLAPVPDLVPGMLGVLSATPPPESSVETTPVPPVIETQIPTVEEPRIPVAAVPMPPAPIPKAEAGPAERLEPLEAKERLEFHPQKRGDGEYGSKSVAEQKDNPTFVIPKRTMADDMKAAQSGTSAPKNEELVDIPRYSKPMIEE